MLQTAQLKDILANKTATTAKTSQTKSKKNKVIPMPEVKSEDQNFDNANESIDEEQVPLLGDEGNEEYKYK